VTSVRSFGECSYFADRELTVVKYLVVSVLLPNSCHTDREQSYSHKESTSDPTMNHTGNVLPIFNFSAMQYFFYYALHPIYPFVHPMLPLEKKRPRNCKTDSKFAWTTCNSQTTDEIRRLKRCEMLRQNMVYQ